MHMLGSDEHLHMFTLVLVGNKSCHWLAFIVAITNTNEPNYFPSSLPYFNQHISDLPQSNRNSCCIIIAQPQHISFTSLPKIIVLHHHCPKHINSNLYILMDILNHFQIGAQVIQVHGAYFEAIIKWQDCK